MAYGDKRDYRKIDVYVDGNYMASTTWAASLSEAVEVYKQTNPVITSRATSITAKYSKAK
jgi:hypothetical protein